MRKVIGFSIAIVLLLLDIHSTIAQFHVAHLRTLSRSGAQVGETFDLSVRGDRLEEVDALYFSHPAITAELKTADPFPFSEDRQPRHGNFSVHVPETVPPGRYEVRASGRHGVTNPRAFLVSPIPNEVLASVSHDRNAPTPLSKNRLLHAVSAANWIDWFTIEIVDGESLTIELLAQRLESAMIGQLKLYDSNGQTVAASRGVDDIDPSLLISGRAQALRQHNGQTGPEGSRPTAKNSLPAGKYLLAVHDFMYRGGADFYYQLLAGKPDSTRQLVNKTTEKIGQLPTHWLPRASTLGDASSFDTEPDPEQTGNSDEARTVELSGEVTSWEATRWFAQGQNDHQYLLNASKDQRLAIDVVSDRITQPTDARLIIQRIERQPTGSPTLHQVAHIDDSPNVTDGVVSLASKDPVTLFTAPAEATYQLSVRDLDIGTSLLPRQLYRFRVRDPNPGFDLVVYRPFPNKDLKVSQPFASKLFRGGTEMIRLLALRRDGWSGPIKVTVENLPEGVRCDAGVIAGNQDKTQLTLVASEGATGRVDSIRVIGQSEDGKISQVAVPVTMVRGRAHGRNSIRSRVSTGIPVAVSDRDLSPLTLTLGDGKVAEVKKGAATSLPIRVVRREGGKTPCVFRPINFPPGITAGEVTIAADASEGKLELKTNGNTKLGTYSISLLVETKIKVRPNPQALQRAGAYRMHLQGLHDDPAQVANLEAIKAAIVEADKRVEAAKAAANEQQQTVFIPTNHTTIRVVQP